MRFQRRRQAIAVASTIASGVLLMPALRLVVGDQTGNPPARESAQHDAISCTDCPPGPHKPGGAELADGRPRTDDRQRTARRIRIHGRIRMVDWDQRDERLGRFVPPLNPLTFGHTEESILSSVQITYPESGGVARSGTDGRFILEGDVASHEARIAVRLSSPFLMLPTGRSSLAVDVPEGSGNDIDLDVPMIPAVAAQPRYNGRIIRPKDLRKPEIQKEFERQMTEIARIVVLPPDPQHNPAPSRDSPSRRTAWTARSADAR